MLYSPADSTLGKWMLVGGSGYKMTLPNQMWQKDGDDPPSNVYAPDSRRTFVDVAQHINSFLAILGAQVDGETYKKPDEWKMLCLPEETDAKYLSSPMSQADVQTLKDDLYQSILTVTGVPNRNGGSSTSDTGQAQIRCPKCRSLVEVDTEAKKIYIIERRK